MKKEVVEDTNIVDSNDSNKFEEVKTYQKVESIKKEPRTDSYFDGGLIELIGWRLLSFLITAITLGIAAPWGACMIYSYQINHTVYNGKRLKFEGTGGDLFVNAFKWVLLSIVTLGIYVLFIPVRKTQWVISNIHYEDEHLIKGESFFDGKTIQLIGINILSTILNFISLGLLGAFTFCFKINWITKHTVINRKKLVFTGRSIAFFGNCIFWAFLTIITFGIFGLWVPIKKLKWQNKNIHIKVVGEEENKKDTSLYIAIPILIIAILLFILVVAKLIPTVGNMDVMNNFSFERVFEDFRDVLGGNKNSAKRTNGEIMRPSLDHNAPGSINSKSIFNGNDSTMPITDNTDNSTNNYSDNTSDNVENVPSSSTSNNSQVDFLEFVGTYVDAFGGSSELIIDKNGKVTISEKVVTNNLASIQKQSDGSYSCPISGGEIIIYPVGVKSSQGNSNKIIIDVIENYGALCFKKK